MTAKNFTIHALCEAGNMIGVNEIIERTGEGNAAAIKEIVNLPSMESKLTPLMSACKSGEKQNLDVAKLLIKHGALVDERSSTSSCTALHIAARKANLAMVKYLVEEAHASLEHRTRAGETVADWASNPAIKEYLLSKM